MIIGTAGHIDHGKTSLVKALTGIDADRLKEEKARGITIDLGYAYTPLPNGDVLGFVDVPGHEKLVHNMLAGVTGIDFVLLLVAADDGPMPQTREHLAILDLLVLNRGAVAISKIDRVSPGQLQEATAQIESLLADTALSNSPVFPVSSLSGEGIEALRLHLEATAANLAIRPAHGYFRLAVDRAFTLTGTGTVVTGTVSSGEVRIGDKLLVSPAGIEVRVRSIHAQNRPAEMGRAGQRCALNLAGAQFDKSDVGRGDWILGADIHAPAQRLDVELKLLSSESKALKHWTPVHVHLGAADISGRVALLEAETLQPGQSGLAQIVLDRPLSALYGDRFILRDQSATRSIGGGKVLDPFPPMRHRRAPARIAALHAAKQRDPAAALAHALQVETCVDLARFIQSRNLRREEAETLWKNVPIHRINAPPALLGIAATKWDELKQTLRATLAHEHAQSPDSLGPDRERLRRMALPSLPRPAFAALLEEMLAAGEIARTGPWLHLPEHKVTLSPAEEKIWQGILPLLLAEPFQPPRVRDIAKAMHSEESRVRLLLKRVARMGEAYVVAHDHFFARQAVEKLAAIAAAIGQGKGVIRAAEFRDRIGTGRKLAIQILEFFDRIGLTRRTGDDHMLRREKLIE